MNINHPFCSSSEILGNTYSPPEMPPFIFLFPSSLLKLLIQLFSHIKAAIQSSYTPGSTLLNIIHIIYIKQLDLAVTHCMNCHLQPLFPPPYLTSIEPCLYYLCRLLSYHYCLVINLHPILFFLFFHFFNGNAHLRERFYLPPPLHL